MRKNKSLDLINYFKKYSARIFSIKDLAAEFDISERQIKNYIRQINEVTAPDSLILPAGPGQYRLCENYHQFLPLFHLADYLPKERISIILSRLLVEDEGIDIFDLAEEIYVSRPTLESDLNKIRKMIVEFQMTLSVSEDIITLKGSEQAKRKLTSYMITNDSYTDFMNHQELRFLNNTYQTSRMLSKLSDIFHEYHITYNDYSLNNIVLHLIITIDRIRSNCELPDTMLPGSFNDTETAVVRKIVDFLEEDYGISFSSVEFDNLAHFISCNFAAIDYSHIDSRKARSYVSQECQELTEEILRQIADYYYLEAFDEIFMSRFMLHLENLLRRLRNHYTAKNPLSMELKNTYPLIYDVAVFIADIIQEKTHFVISQDEISFIALHIGGGLETSKQQKNKLTAIYIYADYHGFYQFNVEKLQNIFSENLNIRYTISFNDYFTVKPTAELIISEFAISDVDAVVVSPFLTESEIAHIRERIQSQNNQNQIVSFQKIFFHMADKNYFFTNIQGKDKFDTLTILLENLGKFGLFLPDFPAEVLKREQLSSTAFHNDIAVPHAISQSVKKSFLSFVCYEKGIPWGNEKVRLIILIGMAYSERKRFRSLFSHLVELLSVPANTSKISSSRTYEELVEHLNEILQNH